MSFFQDLGNFFYNNPEAEAQRSFAHALSLCLIIQRDMRVTVEFCLRVIVNEQPLNIKKTTSSVLSVLLLIYSFADQPKPYVLKYTSICNKHGYNKRILIELD